MTRPSLPRMINKPSALHSFFLHVAPCLIHIPPFTACLVQPSALQRFFTLFFFGASPLSSASADAPTSFLFVVSTGRLFSTTEGMGMCLSDVFVPSSTRPAYHLERGEQLHRLTGAAESAATKDCRDRLFDSGLHAAISYQHT